MVVLLLLHYCMLDSVVPILDINLEFVAILGFLVKQHTAVYHLESDVPIAVSS